MQNPRGTMQKGTLILVMGPSGSGKGSLLAYLRNQFSDSVFPITWTTRAPRVGEVDSQPNPSSGKTYHFVSEQEFTDAVTAGAFLESAAYGGYRYGTPKTDILHALAEGKTVLQELEIQGIRQIKSALPQEYISVIYVDAGSWDELRKRILARGPMSEEDLAKRKQRYEEEIVSKSEADYVVENREGALELAQKQIAEIIDEIRRE